MCELRHQLKDDVRESMYDACREWTAAVRAGGSKFQGGDRPSLGDLVRAYCISLFFPWCMHDETAQVNLTIILSSMAAIVMLRRASIRTHRAC
jgi:hypothetical protein